ncbi:D-tagatose-1,6-bisphosphate aldolase subunit KbaY [bacterium HR39]|nr:D-tagatose-1,6-bisphosphate aldolase subunit KbaY [bacterium HR39]
MPLVDMRDLLRHAHANRYAVGAFDLVDTRMLEGILVGCERAGAPAILSVAESHFRHFDPGPVLAACVAAARRSPLPLAIHLDHGESLESIERGIALGCNGVMLDASHLPFAENVRRTRAAVELAHACGVPVEGELGYVAGAEGEDAELHPGEIVYTSPDEAEAFVARTQVDFLAVSIGTVHGRLRGTPRLDLERLAAIDRRLGIPLVIHGGTGLAAEQYRALAERGVAKINYFTALADAAARTVHAAAREDPQAGLLRLLRDVREAVAAETERACRMFGAAGRAGEALAACRPWREVEHVVLYRPREGLDGAELAAMVEEGRRQLAKVPGVRRVFHGRKVAGRDDWPLGWVIRFASAAVVEAYRDHPLHLAFADGRFRPNAPERLSLDLEEW